jgi:hypothetical protein
LNKRAKLRLLLVFIFIGFIIAPAFADDQTIKLSPEVPYVDVTVEATAPTQITIETITGTPQTNSGFIDSWIELWQGVNKLFANDDGAHSATNVLASYISAPIEAGTYFIRATSYALMCCNQTPTGNYLLTWNGVTTIPTIIPTPTLIPTETIIEEPTLTPTIEPTQTIEPTPTQEPIVDNEPILVEETQSAIPEPTLIIEAIPEPEITALENIPGAEQIFAATEAILNVGSDMTQEQREESQAVVVATIVVSQIASMASVTASTQNKRFKK